MQEELEQVESVSIQTETQTSVENEQKQTLDSLPRIEDLRKSEKEVNKAKEIEGVSEVDKATKPQDRIFVRKEPLLRFL